MAYWKEEELKKEFSAIGIGKTGKVLKTSEHQTGKTIRSIDMKRSALPSGKRLSKYGKVYYEYRKNRTDLTGGKI